jgi:hypothetical protein
MAIGFTKTSSGCNRMVSIACSSSGYPEMVADLMLDKQALQAVLSKKW